ncbi:Por secretion system C-terminal sorting domain-containing protein [Catalinimonas alkaloidigena]|uniref:Por secretion system C-terminal sorting domain-containing protein n=1 Tax=Catalinimonas alkaloidigena TaxID=1075417 RepID=A0A1G9RC73_9BACT|nr:T9SS type A sorting domain-containing protein [Catalinimonas alkaloidigena]SDM20690.1 Por secretion system C-terminal sorting domain-containing protein [Catalinimonas alkaloidigena]
MLTQVRSRLGAFLVLAGLSSVSLAQTPVFINEIHYDNVGTDTGEAIEIAGPAGTDLTGWSLVLYNGSNNQPYTTSALSGTLADAGSGYGFAVVTYPSNGIQNGDPDGVALVNSAGAVIQFLSYDGTMTAATGPAQGLTSIDIGVGESNATTTGFSLQLTGSGSSYEDFTWADAQANTFGAVNAGQTFGGGPVGPADPVINEFSASTTGTDVEYIEILGDPNADYSDLTVLEIEGDTPAQGTIDGIFPLGTTDANGYFLLNLPANELENGTLTLLLVRNFADTLGADLDADNDGVLDVTPWTDLVDGIAVNDGGAGDQTYAVTLNVGYDGLSFAPGGASRLPNGTDTDQTSDWTRNDFDLAGIDGYEGSPVPGEAYNTPGAPNQAVAAPLPAIVINELDVDQDGTDAAEFIELYDGGVGNTALNGLVLVLFNGNGDEAYGAIALDGYTTDAEGYFVVGSANVANVDLVAFTTNGLQNGADAVALYQGDAAAITTVTTDGLIDAVVYGTSDADDEGLLALLNAGQPQADENANGQAISESLQRLPNGSGGQRNTDTFGAAAPTPGTENGGDGGPVEPQPGLITIAEARNAADDAVVTIQGILTVADEFGGPAYIQDSTGGIAVFDAALHGGTYQIGDEVKLTGALDTYNGLREVVSVTHDSLVSTGNSVTPAAITVAQLAAYEGQLVTLQNVSFPNPGDLFWPNSNFVITDATGSGELRIDADVEGIAGKAQPETCEVTGVIGQFNGTPQLLPRLAGDLPCAEDFVPPTGDTDLPLAQTLDVVTWNVEWFGSPSQGPTNETLQADNVKRVLDSLDADVYALEEISDSALLQQVVDQLPGYALAIQTGYVSYPPNEPRESQKLAFIYKTETVSPVRTQPLLDWQHPYYNGGDDSYLTDYPADDRTRFFASGRLPFLMVADVTIDGSTERIYFVGLHARANGSDAQLTYDMRKYDVERLKAVLDTLGGGTANVMLLGDYNDDVDETVANISSTVTSYAAYVQDDSLNPGADGNYYAVLTSSLSDAGFRTYVSYENVIDHITVTDELTDNYIANSATVHYEVFAGNSVIPNYASTTSDHMPVSVRLVLEKAPALTLGSCVYTVEDFPGAATITALDSVTYWDFFQRRGSYTVGVATGVRTDGQAGAWEIHNDCSIKPLRKSGSKQNTSLLPDVLGAKRKDGWHYEPYAISDDGEYILANAINTDGYTIGRWRGVAPGATLPVKFRIGGPLLGRVFILLGTVDCDDLAMEWTDGRYLLTGCDASEEVPTRVIASVPVQTAQTHLYPNPARQSITVQFAESLQSNATLRVVDALGRLYAERTVEAGQVEYQEQLSNLPSGIYFMQVQTAEGVQNLRFVKQ